MNGPAVHLHRLHARTRRVPRWSPRRARSRTSVSSGGREQRLVDHGGAAGRVEHEDRSGRTLPSCPSQRPDEAVGSPASVLAHGGGRFLDGRRGANVVDRDGAFAAFGEPRGDLGNGVVVDLARSLKMPPGDSVGDDGPGGEGDPFRGGLTRRDVGAEGRRRPPAGSGLWRQRRRGILRRVGGPPILWAGRDVRPQGWSGRRERPPEPPGRQPPAPRRVRPGCFSASLAAGASGTSPAASLACSAAILGRHALLVLGKFLTCSRFSIAAG